MKLDFFRTAGALFRGLLRGKRREAKAFETYLSTSESVDKLITKRMLGINLKTRHVVVDARLHLLLMPHKVSGYAIAESDRRYAAFFDKVVAYMNLRLAAMGKKEFIDPITDEVTFNVVMEQRRYFDDEGMPLPAHQQVVFHTILVGVYRGGKIDYKAVEKSDL